MYYSKLKVNERIKEGVGLILIEQLDRRVKVNEPISPRILHTRMELENINLDIIPIYAPVDRTEKGKIEVLDEQLQDTTERIEETISDY